MIILEKPITRAELSTLAEDSLINIRPRQGNRSRDVENEEIREKIRQIVNKYMA